MNNITQFLNKPFPQEESMLDTVKIVTAISVFVALFLYIFQPFGLHTIESNLLWLCLGFGTVAFSTSLVYEFFVVKVLKVKGVGTHFTYGKWIVYFVGVILFISLANFIYVRLVIFDDIQWHLFPAMMRGTFAIAIFPTVVVGALALLRQEHKYQHIAAEINRSSTPVASEVNTAVPTFFGVSSDQIRYVEAMQNYINVGYVLPEDGFQERTERATLKSILNEHLGESVVRCHRSYLVNQDAIVAVSGNAQGLILTLADCDKTIPVSRSYVATFRTQ